MDGTKENGDSRAAFRFGQFFFSCSFHPYRPKMFIYILYLIFMIFTPRHGHCTHECCFLVYMAEMHAARAHMFCSFCSEKNTKMSDNCMSLETKTVVLCTKYIYIRIQRMPNAHGYDIKHKKRAWSLEVIYYRDPRSSFFVFCCLVCVCSKPRGVHIDVVHMALGVGVGALLSAGDRDLHMHLACLYLYTFARAGEERWKYRTLKCAIAIGWCVAQVFIPFFILLFWLLLLLSFWWL